MSSDFSSLELTDTPDGCTFAVKVIPGSSRDRVVSVLGNALKIDVSSPPEKGAANKALLKLLAGHFNLRPNQLRILSGHSQPRKRILVVGLTGSKLRLSRRSGL